MPHRTLFAATVWITLAGSASATTYTTVLDNGPSSNRVDMIFVGDGYLDTQITTVYANDVNNMLNNFFNGGLDGYFFSRYEPFFNAHRVNVVSNEAGTDIPLQNIYVDTALNSTHQVVSGTDDRLLVIDTGIANAYVNSALSGTGIDTDLRLATVNSAKYGGSGGQWAVYAGSNSSAQELALHELGHSFADLADEYAGFTTPYAGNEPSEPNVTKDPAAAKWQRWVGYDDPDTDVGPIAAFEGARYYDQGLYRPSDNSKMRSLGQPFDAVSREAFIETIYQEVDPLDGWLDTASVLTDPASLWVQTVDDGVIAVDWYVDDVLVLSDFGAAATPADLGLTDAGLYDVQALAYDRVLDAAFTGGPLDWWRLADTSLLQQTIGWQVDLTFTDLIGDYNGDGFVSQGDLDLVLLNWGDSSLPTGWAATDQFDGGLISQNELDGVLLNWGNGVPTSLAAIPEPTAAALLGLTSLTFMRRRQSAEPIVCVTR